MIFRIIVILITGWMTLCMYADERDNSRETIINTQAFWKVYTDALRGDQYAQFQVGVMYERGMGIDQNQSLAAKWYDKAATQGHIDAQYNIGIMYASGRGVEKNDQLAMMWLASASKQGDKEARQVLNEIIDGKINTETSVAQESPKSEQRLESITPVTLICTNNSFVCDRYGGKGDCIPFKAKTALTATGKQGNYYKISGIVKKQGWEAFRQEGWIEASSVEVRR